MRNQFTDMIESGIAPGIKHNPMAGEIPNNDPICREYNNIFSIPSDTRMTCVCIDGICTRIISGRLISQSTSVTGKMKLEKFIYNTFNWGVSYTSAGYCSPSDFFYKHGLCYTAEMYNNELVLKVCECNMNGSCDMCGVCQCADSIAPIPMTTGESMVTDPDIISRYTNCQRDTIKESIDALNSNIGGKWHYSHNGHNGLFVGYDNGKITFIYGN